MTYLDENGALQAPCPRVFHPLLQAARYKGAYGGRGSGKSHFFAELLIGRCIKTKGTRAIGIREVQKDLQQSSKKLLENKIVKFEVGHMFEVQSDCIITPGDGLIIFKGMNNYTAESVKSLEDFDIGWWDEAAPASERSLDLLLPTLRKPGSEFWASWNPRKKNDPIEKLLRHKPPRNSVVVEANHRDNPWWNETLELERLRCFENEPEKYGHIWEGEYISALTGAYFASCLNEARRDGRLVPRLAVDPLITIRAYWDIGGAGAKGDATAIWVTQWVGQEIRVLDYIEGQGQVLGYYVEELRRRGWERAHCYLPHDGVNANTLTGKRYEDHIREAGFTVNTIKNLGQGAAMMRVEAVRRHFGKCVFNEVKCKAGIDALGWYHAKRDDGRDVDLGPDHDWSSHGADAFGLMAVDYVEPKLSRAFNRTLVYPDMGIV